jgi:phosphinothricin acetyltransferase
MNLEFRDATIEDLPRIVEIYNSTVAGRMVTADTEPVSVESRSAWFREHDPSFRPLWMMREEDNDIGWISFQSFYGRPAYNATAEISIYLDQTYRGKGYGLFGLEYAIGVCPELGIQTLLGYIFAHNDPSIRLFKKTGFETWGYFPGIANLDGIERDLVIVGKRITK